MNNSILLKLPNYLESKTPIRRQHRITNKSEILLEDIFRCWTGEKIDI
uniref:Uncharacterized protein n=1 Tax=Ascaris lumbricoides TaxID=6252 RepID=A0A0M3IW05_ASCLU